MRRFLYIIVVALLLAIPVQRRDVGDMLPVELVMVYTKGSGVEICTDTGNRGTGNSLLEAAWDLKESASKEIFLDTAQYLILAGDGISTEDLQSIFKDRIYVCKGSRTIDLEEVAQYLSGHKPKYCLKDMKHKAKPEEIRKTSNGFMMS